MASIRYSPISRRLSTTGVELLMTRSPLRSLNSNVAEGYLHFSHHSTLSFRTERSEVKNLLFLL